MTQTTRFDPEPDDITHVHLYCGAVTLPNSTALDGALSLRARGLLLHLMALRTTQPGPLRTGEVYRTVVEGRDAVTTAVGELKSAGYLTQRKERVATPLGRVYFITVTDVYATPQGRQKNAVAAPEENRLFDLPQPEVVPDLVVAPRAGFQGLAETLEIGSPGPNSVGTSSRGTQTATQSSSAPGRRAPSRPSRRAIAEAALAAEEEIDPARAVAAMLAVEPGLAAVGDPAPRSRTRSVSPGEKLARYFDSIAHLHTPVPEPTNITALAGTFNRWRRDGVDPATIRAMIGAYFEPGFARKDARAPWKDFIAARSALMARVGPGGAAPTGEDHRHDQGYWAPRAAS